MRDPSQGQAREVSCYAAFPQLGACGTGMSHALLPEDAMLIFVEAVLAAEALSILLLLFGPLLIPLSRGSSKQ